MYKSIVPSLSDKFSVGFENEYYIEYVSPSFIDPLYKKLNKERDENEFLHNISEYTQEEIDELKKNDIEARKITVDLTKQLMGTIVLPSSEYVHCYRTKPGLKITKHCVGYCLHCEFIKFSTLYSYVKFNDIYYGLGPNINSIYILHKKHASGLFNFVRVLLDSLLLSQEIKLSSGAIPTRVYLSATKNKILDDRYNSHEHYHAWITYSTPEYKKILVENSKPVISRGPANSSTLYSTDKRYYFENKHVSMDSILTYEFLLSYIRHILLDYYSSDTDSVVENFLDTLKLDNRHDDEFNRNMFFTIFCYNETGDNINYISSSINKLKK